MLRVAPGSVAAKDGSKGKAIVQMGDEPIRNIGERSMLLIAHPPGNTVTVVCFTGNEKRTTQATFAAQPKSLETVVETLRDGNVISSLVTDPEGQLIGTWYLEDADRKLACRKNADPLQIGNYEAHLHVKKRKWM